MRNFLNDIGPSNNPKDQMVAGMYPTNLRFCRMLVFSVIQKLIFPYVNVLINHTRLNTRKSTGTGGRIGNDYSIVTRILLTLGALY